MKDKIKIGLDISKQKLDSYCDFTNEFFVLTNDDKGFNQFLSWMDAHGFSTGDLQIAFEHTGHYGHLLMKFCDTHAIEYYQIPALEIKKSLGITRGKNDIIDSKRICQYLQEKAHRLRPQKPINNGIERLKLLKAQRALYVKQRAAVQSAQNDLVEVLALPKDDLLVSNNQLLIKEYTEKIRVIEKEIQAEITSDNLIKENYDRLLSIIGIGPVIAVDTILATENFTKFNNWRQYASYSGSAPFEYSSGKYIGKKRISHLANKEIKAHLTSGAKCAKRFDPELKKYYETRIKDGKQEKCVINVIRCKLIARMFSLVKNKRYFEKSYSHNLVVSET